MKSLSLQIILVILTLVKSYGQLPEGFVDELISEDLESPVGIEFIDSQLFYIWNQHGYIYMMENSTLLDTPLLNLSAEVSGTADHGMLGMALDPNFSLNGYIYLSYVVDPHFLRFFGTNQYDPPEFDVWNATIGRVVRYQVDIENKKQIIGGSRTILLGDTITNGIPVLAPAHGVGGLDFGTDGTLLIGTGDGTTWVGNHTGGESYKEFGFDSLGKILGIIDSFEDIGSYRAQLLDSYSGKILRIDPMTGQGIPSNPFFDPLDPEAPRSKVWSLGLRSPFRLRVRPGSGSNDPADGRPGNIYVGDVGSNQYEEFNIISEAGRNLGWPSFEGHFPNEGYQKQNVVHEMVSHQLKNEQVCSEPIHFDELLIATNRQHQFHWPNPCDSFRSLEEFTETFVHERPAISYGNTVNNAGQVFFSGFDTKGSALAISADDPSSPTISPAFDGISSVVGDFYFGDVFPAEYRGNYFHADFGGWIRTVIFDSHDGTDEIHEIQSFAEMTNSIVYVRYNEFDQALYYVVLDYSARPNLYQLRKISFTDNPKPIAIIDIDTLHGFSPLSIKLSAASSYDPRDEPISFTWIIDGRDTFHFTDTTLTFTHNGSARNISVHLLVQDTSGLFDSVSQNISINNSPPSVDITSIDDGQGYRLDASNFDLALTAFAQDAEQADATLFFNWEIKLKHNDHFHVEFVDTAKSSQVTLPALSSTELDRYSYLITLTVNDSLGLTGFDQVHLEPLVSTSSTDALVDDGFLGYPIPTADYLTIESKRDASLPLLNWKLIDGLGRMIRHKRNTSLPFKIDCTSLPVGNYWIQLTDQNNLRFYLRFVKI